MLVEQLNSHDGAEVPMHMLAKVAVRVHKQSMWQGRMDKIRRQITRRALAVAGMLLANVAVVAGHWMASHDAGVADRESFVEYRRATDETIVELRKDIRELRGALTAALRRLGMAAPSEPDSTIDSEPETFSLAWP